MLVPPTLLGLTDAVRDEIAAALLRITRSRRHDVTFDEVEDALGYAILQAVARNPEVNDLRAWLMRVAINRVHDVVTHARRARTDSLDAPRGDDDTRPRRDALADATDVARAIETALDAPRVGAAIRRALAALPASQRRVVWLRARHGLEHREVADRLGITIGASKMRWKRGCASLRDALRRDPVAAPYCPTPTLAAA